MKGRIGIGWRWLAGIVFAHVAITVAHGFAHRQAAVNLSPGSVWFVNLVILAGPLLGLALAWWMPRPGALLMAGTLAGALAFGVVNHFVAAGPDHVAHIASRWRPLFAATAILLAVSEAAGAGLALRLARERKSS